MSIASEITRIAGFRDTIRSKLLDFGIITSDSANLSDCATAIDGINKVTPSIPDTTITIDTAPTLNKSTGVITMSASKSASVTPTVSKGYTDGSGTAGTITAKVSSTLQLSPTLAAKTYTPGTSNQTIAAQRWLTGAQTIKGDSNLVAANIKSGVKIFNVTGSASTAKTITGSMVPNVYTIPSSYNSSTGVASSGTNTVNAVEIPLTGISTVLGACSVNEQYLTGAPDEDGVMRYKRIAYIIGFVTYGTTRLARIVTSSWRASTANAVYASSNRRSVGYYTVACDGTSLILPVIKSSTQTAHSYNYFLVGQ